MAEKKGRELTENEIKNLKLIQHNMALEGHEISLDELIEAAHTNCLQHLSGLRRIGAYVAFLVTDVAHDRNCVLKGVQIYWWANERAGPACTRSCHGRALLQGLSLAALRCTCSFVPFFCPWPLDQLSSGHVRRTGSY